MSFNAAVGGDQGGGTGEHHNVIFEIGLVERGEIQLLLILQGSFYTAPNQSVILELPGAGRIARLRGSVSGICRWRTGLPRVQGLSAAGIGQIGQRWGLCKG